VCDRRAVDPLLTHVRFAGQPTGVAFALANAALFSAYIVLAHRVARRPAMSGIDGLAAAMLIAFVFVSPVGLPGAVHALTDPVALLAGVGVWVSSSVIPYVCDQLAMARLPRATYALFVALLPATATIIGVTVLGQLPSLVELGGVALVMAGVALHRREQGQAASSAGSSASDRSSPAGAASAAAPIVIGPTANSATAATDVARIMNVQPLRNAPITPAGDG
jgi:inner membrane transporter RhtA